MMTVRYKAYCEYLPRPVQIACLSNPIREKNVSVTTYHDMPQASASALWKLSEPRVDVVVTDMHYKYHSRYGFPVLP